MGLVADRGSAARRACHVGARRRFLSRRRVVERLGDADAAARRCHAMIEAVQAWAARYAADRRYSPVGQGFHWTMAALILFQLFWGRSEEHTSELQSRMRIS